MRLLPAWAADPPLRLEADPAVGFERRLNGQARVKDQELGAVY
jgi:hypothetical protein